MSAITDIASNPSVAIPIAAGVTGINFVTLLPIIINVATAIYLCMLIGHKAWTWWREWKGKQQIQDKDELP